MKQRENAKNLGKLFFVIVAPFLVLSSIGGLVNGYLYVVANGYFDQGFDYIGIQFIRTQINRELLTALLIDGASDCQA
jgi:hypothetical protein